MEWIKKETTVIDKLCSNNQLLANTVDTALWSAFSKIDEHAYGQDILLAKEVLRSELGLDVDQKPGDIDLLIIPIVGDSPLLHKTVAIEAKVVRPTVSKPSKNASSMGVTQTKGLLRDGFPYISLLHVVIPESLPSEMHWSIPLKSMELDDNGDLKDTGEVIKHDPFPLISAGRQKGRIVATDLPEEASYRVLGLSLTNGDISGITQGDLRMGKVNPNVSDTLLANIRKFLVSNPDRFKRIKWFE